MKGLQKGGKVGFLKEAYEFIQVCGYSRRGQGRTQNWMCWDVFILGTASPTVLSQHPVPGSWATSTVDHCVCIPSSQEDGVPCCQMFLIGKKKLEPKEAKRVREETTRQSDGPRHHSGTHELVVKRIRNRLWLGLRKMYFDYVPQ